MKIFNSITFYLLFSFPVVVFFSYIVAAEGDQWTFEHALASAIAGVPFVAFLLLRRVFTAKSWSLNNPEVLESLAGARVSKVTIHQMKQGLAVILFTSSDVFFIRAECGALTMSNLKDLRLGELELMKASFAESWSTKERNPNSDTMHALFVELWTAAGGAAGYQKSNWMEFEQLLRKEGVLP